MILLDSDVLLDVAMERQPHDGPASEILDLIQDRIEEGCVAWHSISNVYYILRRQTGDRDARDFIRHLLRFVDVVPTGRESVRSALQMPISDFEDALQVAAAEAAGALMIVTRNLAHYRNSAIRVVSPSEAVAELS